MGALEDIIRKVAPTIFEGAKPDVSDVALPANIKSEVPAAFKEMLANPPKDKVVILAEYPPHLRIMKAMGEKIPDGNFPGQAVWWKNNIGKDFDVTIIPFYAADIGHELKDVKKELMGIKGSYSLAIMGHEGSKLGGYPISELTKVKEATKHLGIKVGNDVPDSGVGVGKLMYQNSTSKNLRPGLGQVASGDMGYMEPDFHRIDEYQKWLSGDTERMPIDVENHLRYNNPTEFWNTITEFKLGNRFSSYGDRLRSALIESPAFNNYWREEAKNPDGIMRKLHEDNLAKYNSSLHVIESNFRSRPTISGLVNEVNYGQIKNVIIGGCAFGRNRAEDIQDLSTSTGTDVYCQSGESWGTGALKSIGKKPQDKFFVSGKNSGGMVFHPTTNPTMSEGRHKNPIYTWKTKPGANDAFYYDTEGGVQQRPDHMNERVSWATRGHYPSALNLGNFSLTNFADHVAKSKAFGIKHIAPTLNDYRQNPRLEASSKLFTPSPLPGGSNVMDNMIRSTKDIEF